MTREKYWLVIVMCWIFAIGCKSPETESQAFTLRTAEQTGLKFANELDVTLDLNILNYMYYYNGGGLAAGDFNNDGWIDLYFTSNQSEDKMYLNKGQLTFEDISEHTEVDAGQGGWTTGACVVDINADGLLDIYVCQVGKYENLNAKNRLLICTHIDDQGIPHYEEQATKYGLDFQGFSTQAGFLDYDRDGDLDMFLMNHSLHHNGTFGKRKDFVNTRHELSGDRFFRNDDGRFIDITAEVGIQSSVIGYGLGLAFGDINLDGYPDIYVANDFHENDYLYINQGDGTFDEELPRMMMHTSRFSMGCDIADINNDGYSDVMTLDMLPEDPEVLKRSEGEEAINVFNYKLSYGYKHQYAMNCLQLNNGNGSFSEIGRYAGVHATDWSWSPLLVDWNLDGLKDIFISNGIPKRMNDIDYINYMSGNDIQYKIEFNRLEKADLGVIDMIPEIKIRNKIYLNSGNMEFQDLEGQIEGDRISYSNSAVYADFDNDGDYDIVTNNINEEAFLYENQMGQNKASTKIILSGPDSNPNGIGTKVLAYVGAEVQYIEHYATRAFQSSMLVDILVARPKGVLDSVVVVWPDGRYHKLVNVQKDSVSFSYSASLPFRDNAKGLITTQMELVDNAHNVGLGIKHKENAFVEFHREPLIPHSTSQQGPALAIGDLNGDGLDDVFLGSSKGNQHTLMFQTSEGPFEKMDDGYLNIDKSYEQVDAEILDVNGDGYNDLILANGGNEYPLYSEFNRPQLFINRGNGQLRELEHAFDSVMVTASNLTIADYDQDGDQDLFIGGRAVPYSYGEIPRSYLLQNDGNGHFRDVTKATLGDFELGLVRSSRWIDVDSDNDMDLVVAVEWGDIFLFRQELEGRFEKTSITGLKGWWSCIEELDYDGDGDVDLFIGNLGKNSRLKASKEAPVRMYYADFDNNGSKEQLVTYNCKGREIPFHSMMELQKQMPYLKDKYQYAKDFARVSPRELMGKEKMGEAILFEANYFDNSILLNDGSGNFRIEALPYNLQWTTYNDACQLDVTGDGKEEIVLVGNNYGSNVQMGRYDADWGTILAQDKKGSWQKQRIDGNLLEGQIRKVKRLKVGNEEYLVMAINNGNLKVVSVAPF